MCIHSLGRKADDKPEIHTIKKRPKFKLTHKKKLNLKSVHESQQRLGVYLVCHEIGYYK